MRPTLVRRRRVPHAVAALLLALAACAPSGREPGAAGDRIPTEPGTPAAATGLSAQREGDALVVRNGTDALVRVAVVERVHFEQALALWSFGQDDGGTPVAPGAALRLPLAGITGYEPGDREAIVFWWTPRPGTTPEQKAAAVQQLVVPIG